MIHSPDYENHPLILLSQVCEAATFPKYLVSFAVYLPLWIGGAPVRMNGPLLSFFQSACSTLSAKAGYERQHHVLGARTHKWKTLIWSHGQERNSLNTRLIFPVDHNYSKLTSIFLNYNAKIQRFYYKNVDRKRKREQLFLKKQR